jgi:hypothetical protein
VSKTKLTLSKFETLRKQYNQVDFGELEIEFEADALSSIITNNIVRFLNQESVEQAVETGTTDVGSLTARMIGYYFGISENAVRYGIEGIIRYDSENQQGFLIDENHKTFSDAGVKNEDIVAFWAKNATRFKSKTKMPTFGSPNDVDRRFVRRSSFDKWVKIGETNYLPYKRVAYSKGITFYNKETGKVKTSLSCIDLNSVKQVKLFAV